MVPRLDTIALLVVLVVGLAFHCAYCLVPSLRYLRARRGAYLLGGVAYVLIGAWPLTDAFVEHLSVVGFRVYLVIAWLLFAIVAWRPYAFVRATAGPRPMPDADSADG